MHYKTPKTMEEKGNIIVYGNYIVNNGDYTEIHHVDHYYNYAKEEAGGGAVPKGASLLLPAVADADAVEVDSHEEVGEVLRQVASALAPADPQGLTAQVFERIFLEPQSQPQRQQLQEYALASLRSNHRVTYRMGAAALAPLVRIIGRLHQLGVYSPDTDRAALVQLIPSGPHNPSSFYKALNAYARRGASDNTPRKQPELDLLAWITDIAAEARGFLK